MIVGGELTVGVGRTCENRLELCARRGFKRYGLQEEARSRVGKPIVEKDPAFEKLEELWNTVSVPIEKTDEVPGVYGFGRYVEPSFLPNYRLYYDLLSERLNSDKLSKQFDADSIEFCSLALTTVFERDTKFAAKAGMFLSALINFGPDKDYTIHTSQIPLCYLGYRNIKDITIKGSVGFFIACEMQKGCITVEGNAGKITIPWSADKEALSLFGTVGFKMGGGTLRIKGYAKDKVGPGMTGGRIYVDGDFEGVSMFCSGGQIYHEGVFQKRTGPRLLL